jgi:phosphoenolpyruvate synthase/pyruvate phosphate dikinase
MGSAIGGRSANDREVSPLLNFGGRAGVPGVANGRVMHIDDLADDWDTRGTDKVILLTPFSPPEVYAAAARLAAVVATNGSRLCHLAILLRENPEAPIPYIYGVRDLGAIPCGVVGRVVVRSDGGDLQIAQEHLDDG